jgi:hypothetical protein
MRKSKNSRALTSLALPCLFSLLVFSPCATAQETPSPTQESTADKVANEVGDAVGGSMDNITEATGKAVQQTGDSITMSGRLRDALGDPDNITCDPQKAIQTGKDISGAGKLIQAGGTIIQVGDIGSTAAGHLAEGDYTGAAIQTASGVGKAVTTGKGMLLGAAYGAPLGPVGAFIGGVIGAVASGYIYDKTVGAAANYADQKVKDYTTQQELGGTPQRRPPPDSDAGRSAARDAAQQAAQAAARSAAQRAAQTAAQQAAHQAGQQSVQVAKPPPPPPTTRPPSPPSSGGCRGPCN